MNGAAKCPVFTNKKAEYIPKIVVYANWNMETRNEVKTSWPFLEFFLCFLFHFYENNKIIYLKPNSFNHVMEMRHTKEQRTDDYCPKMRIVT